MYSWFSSNHAQIAPIRLRVQPMQKQRHVLRPERQTRMLLSSRLCRGPMRVRIRTKRRQQREQQWRVRSKQMYKRNMHIGVVIGGIRLSNIVVLRMQSKLVGRTMRCLRSVPKSESVSQQRRLSQDSIRLLCLFV
jgi:hypothetical protein